jgi:hypothetical protein
VTEAHAEDWNKSYVHFRTGFVDGGVGGDGSAVFEHGEHRTNLIGFDPFGNEEAKAGKVHRRGNGRQPVLVPYGKFVKFPKKIVVGMLTFIFLVIGL